MEFKASAAKESESLMMKGHDNFGCKHYRRKCKIRAPCCNEIFDCRHCHNESKNAMEIVPVARHDVPRHDIQKVICSLCDTEQDVQQKCINCEVCFGRYFCAKCNIFDDDVSKKQFHCNDCGICRTGGEENFFHCNKCGCCYTILLKDSHIHVEKAMYQNCPVCVEDLFDSIKDMNVLPCGHILHIECWESMKKHSQFGCPMCSKSAINMTQAWERIDEEIASTPMPIEYRNRKVWILCNDCQSLSEVIYHVVGLKCPTCQSYNTKRT